AMQTKLRNHFSLFFIRQLLFSAIRHLSSAFTHRISLTMIYSLNILMYPAFFGKEILTEKQNTSEYGT
ncbi:MAG: hypothetical protein IJN28_07700, partial [Selenomonadales bacterium]|nr:hypothetical protein [Selenomonadales bacterium]